MKHSVVLMLVVFAFLRTNAQSVGIGTSNPHSSSILELNSGNKGLLFPRVADTSSVANPVKGLVVFSLASNRLWIYNGMKWEGNAGDEWWTPLGDSMVFTRRKSVGINMENFIVQRDLPNLLVTGNFLVQEKTMTSSAQPTAAQTFLLPSTAEILLPNDSVLRVQDPGGNGFYPANARSQGNALLLTEKGNQTGWLLKFNSNDFGMGAGDSLIISSQPYPACIDDHVQLLVQGDAAPADFTMSAGKRLYLVFRSDASLQDKGFDVIISRVYSASKKPLPPVSNSGNAMFFNNGSFGVGFNPVSSGLQSIAMGTNARASGASSLSLGLESQAIGNSSCAIGVRSIALAEDSYAFGSNSQALAAGAYVFGFDSKSYAGSSLALGGQLISRTVGGVVLGYGNDTSDAPTLIARSTDRIFQVGNGLIGGISNRSNAITILRNGNIGIGTVQPEASLHLKNETGNRRVVLWQTISGSDQEYFGLGINDFAMRYNVASGSSHIFYSANTQVFSINQFGNATLRGALTQNSDVRLKKDFSTIGSSLDKLKDIHGYRYYWKESSRGNDRQIGLLAQEVKAGFPELVNEGNDGYLSVNYSGFTAVLLEAIHELKKELIEQKKQLEELKKSLKKE